MRVVFVQLGAATLKLQCKRTQDGQQLFHVQHGGDVASTRSSTQTVVPEILMG